MSAVYANPGAAAPALGSVGVPARADDEARLLLRVRAAATLPTVICLAVHLVFLVTYWIPETSAVPAHDWWLSQLSPLVAEATTSAGTGQVPAQSAQLGVGGELLTVAAIVLLLLARHPRRLGQSAVLVPAALGTLVAVVLLLAIAIDGRARSSAVAILLLVLWVGAAAYATFFSLLLDLGQTRPRSWRNGIPLLVGYALIGPAPLAVGRALFGQPLRAAAASLEGNSVALRLSALTTGSTVLLYLSGVGVGVVVWAAYQCWPPRRDLGMLVRIAVVVGSVTVTASLGGVAIGAAERRADQIRLASPARAITFGCGSAQLAQPPEATGAPAPARTLVVTGLGCRTVTSFQGYRQLATRDLDFSVAPVAASGLDGRRLTGRVASAQYGDVLVVAGTTQLDTRADRLAAVRITDARVLWEFSCPAHEALRIRFSGVPAGDDAARGHLSGKVRRHQVVAQCGSTLRRLDPVTGLPGAG
ncbi:hypothetical protein [uncultured Friedmanniella sp.]|uniref:hypothetical protein n=1 Tax=uncultured Friedmanniella sp. TaxID=335381 RepID=UPI0035CB3B8E